MSQVIEDQTTNNFTATEKKKQKQKKVIIIQPEFSCHGHHDATLIFVGLNTYCVNLSQHPQKSVLSCLVLQKSRYMDSG